MSIIKTLNKAHILGIDFDMDKLEASLQMKNKGFYCVYFVNKHALDRFYSLWFRQEPILVIQDNDDCSLTPFDKTNE